MHNDVVAKLENLFSCFRSPSKRYARRTVAGTSRDQILEEKPLPPVHTNKDKFIIPSSQSQPLHSSIIRNNNNSIVTNGNNITIVHVNHGGPNIAQNHHGVSNGSNFIQNGPSWNSMGGSSVHRKGILNVTHAVNGTLIPAVVAPVQPFNHAHSDKRNSPNNNVFDGTNADE